MKRSWVVGVASFHDNRDSESWLYVKWRWRKGGRRGREKREGRRVGRSKEMAEKGERQEERKSEGEREVRKAVSCRSERAGGERESSTSHRHLALSDSVSLLTQQR